MSSEDVRKVSVQDIQLVQNLIERCLQLYMGPEEVVKTLLQQAKIDPGFTELVWQKLVAENPEFFRAYHLRLIVKDQIIRFNHLLEEQVELMGRVSQTGVAPIYHSNGSEVHSLHNTSGAYRVPQFDRPPIKTENMDQPNGSLPNRCTNGVSTLQSFTQVGLDTADSPEDMVFAARNLDTGMVQRTNGEVVIKSEPIYEDSSAFVFGGNENLLESHDAIGEAPASPFNGEIGLSPPPVLSETLLEPGTSSFGFLGQIPRNFSLSDLTADFSSSTEILESYPGSSPYMGTGASLPEPHIKDEQEDIKRSDSFSEGLEL